MESDCGNNFPIDWQIGYKYYVYSELEKKYCKFTVYHVNSSRFFK